jgi:undecaprenyl-diphosphatase
MPRAERALSPRHAAALGLIQGPTELLPVSSSAHTILVPTLAGWRYGELDPGLRKNLEVALHAGAALALLLHTRAPLMAEARELDWRVVALACAPPALAGYVLEKCIEQRAGGPRAIARGLVAGGLAMAIADRRPAVRAYPEAGPRDGLLLGLAQALALAPGVSRHGAALAAARALRFGRRDAAVLSWHAGLPVMLGAGALRGARVARDGLGARLGGALIAGGLAAFGSTAVAARALGDTRAGRALAPFALYRCLIAAILAERSRRLD